MSNLEALKYELICGSKAIDKEKDILIIVHNQIEYVQQCIKSIRANTKNYNLYIWDNNSDKETKQYLETLDANLIRSNENLGFILPNNFLASLSKSNYIILLNSDTVVYPNWDLSMLGYLQQNEDTWLVGNLGGILDENGMGVKVKYGSDIDFVQGWCMCFSRQTYDQFGLFDDKNLEFAFAEDADFSLRLKKEGGKIYALYTDYVYHYGNVTIKSIRKEINNLPSFNKNHKYIAERWSDYLEKERQQVKNVKV